MLKIMLVLVLGVVASEVAFQVYGARNATVWAASSLAGTFIPLAIGLVGVVLITRKEIVSLYSNVEMIWGLTQWNLNSEMSMATLN